MDWPTELSRCIRCGACREVCPIFSLTKLEPDVARGRLARIERADATGRFTKADRVALTRCLQCGRCTEVCKPAVPIPDIIRDAKARAQCASGLIELAAQSVLTDPRRLAKTARNARSFLNRLARQCPGGSGLRLRFALPYLESGRYLPGMPERPYLARHGGRSTRESSEIALFLGCGAGYLFDGIGEAMDRILAELNLTAAVPEQACCGLPAWGAGAVQAAREAAIAWLQSFPPERYETILCPCASCVAHLQNNLPLLLADTPYEEAARQAGERVQDFHVWLRDQVWTTDLSGVRVAVHVPCHTRRGVRGGDAVTGLLTKAGAEVLPLPDELDQACCGMGGTFGVLHSDLAAEIGLPKVRVMLALKPDVIVTACTGCLIQLRDLVDRVGGKVPVRHPLELFAGTLS